MLPDFPFAFPEDLQASSIDNQMRDFTPGWRFYADVNALCMFADQRLVRATQRQSHQRKNRVNEAL